MVFNDPGMTNHIEGMTAVDSNKATEVMKTKTKSAVFHRHLNTDFLYLEQSEGSYLFTSCGRKIFDGSGGAAVASVGWRNERVANAVYKQILAAPYSATIFYTSRVAEELCQLLVDSTDGHMARAYIVNSGRWFSVDGT